MKTRFLKLALAALMLAVVAPAQTAEDRAGKMQDIRKIMSLTGGDKLANQMLDQMNQQMKSSGPAAEKMFAEFRKEFDVNRVLEFQVESYDKHFTASEIKGILAFYESPTGKKMLQELPAIMQEMMTKSMQMAQEINDKIMKKLPEDKREH